MLSVSKCAFWSKWALRHLPVTANLCFELLLKITLGSNDLSRLDGNNIQVRKPANLIILLVYLRVRVLGVQVSPMGVLDLFCLIVLVHVFEVTVIVIVIAAIDHRLHINVNVGHLPLTWIVNGSYRAQLELLLL